MHKELKRYYVDLTCSVCGCSRRVHTTDKETKALYTPERRKDWRCINCQVPSPVIREVKELPVLIEDGQVKWF